MDSCHAEDSSAIANAVVAASLQHARVKRVSWIARAVQCFEIGQIRYCEWHNARVINSIQGCFIEQRHLIVDAMRFYLVVVRKDAGETFTQVGVEAPGQQVVNRAQ